MAIGHICIKKKQRKTCNILKTREKKELYSLWKTLMSKKGQRLSPKKIFKRCLKKQSGQPQKDRKEPFQLGEIGAFQVTKRKADFIPRGGVELVQHEIRRLVQAVLLRGQDAQADQRKITKFAGDGNHGHGRVLVKKVGLDDQGGARFSIRARQGHGNKIPAPHAQPSKSATDSIHSRISCSFGSAARARL